MRIPLNKLLKRQMHVEIALLQDEVTDIVYALIPNAVLHGGTAIWRCYRGCRFSEDLDFYAKPPKNFEEMLGQELGKRGLSMDKYKETKNTIFAKISGNRTQIRLELALREAIKKEVVNYERTDGSIMTIYSLSIENLIKEKANAYFNRFLVRDIYDVFFLTGQLTDFSAFKEEAKKFAGNVKLPVDEKNLRTIVYSGVAPTAKQMLEKVRMRLME